MATKAHDWDKPAEHETKHEETKPDAKPAVQAGMVRVKCIVDTLPWTDQKSLERDEEADVPQSVADIMLKRKQVEAVK